MSGWVGVDLDGTLADHYWPEKGPYEHTRVGEPIMPILNLVKEWLAQGTEVRIFTARVAPNNDPGYDPLDAERAIVEWCKVHIGYALPVTCVKDYQMVQLFDDRAVQVESNTGRILTGFYEVDELTRQVHGAAMDKKFFAPSITFSTLDAEAFPRGVWEVIIYDGEKGGEDHVVRAYSLVSALNAALEWLATQ